MISLLSRFPCVVGVLFGIAAVGAIYATAEAIHHVGMNPFVGDQR